MAQRPILIASDLSPRNDRAVDRAIMLGRQLSLPVCLVHVRRPGSKDVDEIERLEQAARNSLPDPAATVEILLPSGSAPTEIGNVATERDAALIACAVARFNGLNDYFTGTAVDHIIIEGKRPVLVIKQRPHEDYRRLLVAVDFSTHSAHALRVAADMFPEAELTLLHAYHVAYEGFQKGKHLKGETLASREQAMEEFLANDELAGIKQRLRVHFSYGDIGSAIMNEIEALDPDLVVVGTHGSGGVKRMVLGSVASSLLEWVARDMLVVPPARQD
ncbi:MAG TPA: universal stress protein [Sphingomonadaceae bacterium]|nr:universal stress protein [Sphingomonadaceae bacterium]